MDFTGMFSLSFLQPKSQFTTLTRPRVAGTSREAQHLCVLVHGLWGNPNHLEVMAQSLRAKYPEETLHILIAKRNSGSFTYDGIELGGERVCQEIEEEVDKLTKSGQEIKKISMVGYSLGGLVARYAIGLLESKGFFEKIEPVVSSPPPFIAEHIQTMLTERRILRPLHLRS